MLWKTLKNRKAYANGRYIVGQHHATLLGPTCCVRLHGTTTSNDVGTCCVQLETGQTFRPIQTDATMLTNNTQYCWAQHVESVCMEPQQCWHLFALVAYSLKPVKRLGPYKQMWRCWPTTRNIVGPNMLSPFAWNHNNVGTCCVQFETGQTFRPIQTDATLLTNNTQCCWAQHVESVCMEPQQCWHLFALVAYSLKPVKRLGPCKQTQHCWPTTRLQQCCDLLRPLSLTQHFCVVGLPFVSWCHRTNISCWHWNVHRNCTAGWLAGWQDGE